MYLIPLSAIISLAIGTNRDDSAVGRQTGIRLLDAIVPSTAAYPSFVFG